MVEDVVEVCMLCFCLHGEDSRRNGDYRVGKLTGVRMRRRELDGSVGWSWLECHVGSGALCNLIQVDVLCCSVSAIEVLSVCRRNVARGSNES